MTKTSTKTSSRTSQTSKKRSAPSRSSGSSRASARRRPATRRSGSSRRRYAVASASFLGQLVALPARGRVAVPPERGRQIKLILLTVALVLATGGLWLGLDNRFYVYAADVRGNLRTAAEDVYLASDLPGVHVLWARPARAEQLITKRLPNIASASVTCGVPARCTIEIVERQPRMAWEEDGSVWWVDADGVVMPAQGMLTEGWVVRGPLPLAQAEPEAAETDPGEADEVVTEEQVAEEQPAEEQFTAGFRQLPEPVRAALNDLWLAGMDSTAVFQYVPGRGLVFTDPRGWSVVLGEGSGMAQRMRVAELLGSSLQQRGLTPLYVDVRFPEAPYYSLTNQW